MGKKLKIGLIFSYDENWIGGTYYIMNIIKMLNQLENDKKPFLQIISYKKEDFNEILKLNYPFIEFILVNKSLPVFFKILNKISRLINSKNFISKSRHLKKVEVLFPSSFESEFNSVKRKIFWIPDFQEHFLPNFFNADEVESRKKYQAKIAEQNFIIFSSSDALNSFSTFYPNSIIKKYVFNFVSILPNYSILELRDVLHKHNLTKEKYFFSPNQFWEHKNHKVILNAIKKLKKTKKLDFQVYFSGKEYDYRNPTYFQSLKDFVTENGIEDNIKFLGFIDRVDQICLMNNALGIIQPSLFEGWSSVVEDAKALNQNIIASDLAVHKEQLLEKAFYFNPKNEDSLIKQLEIVNSLNKKNFDFNYLKVIEESSNNFISIMEDVKKKSKLA